MEDQNTKSDGQDSGQVEEATGSPLLERPPADEMSQDARSGFFLQNDSLASVSARLVAAESILDLLVRDLSFDDFMREVLVRFLKAVPCEAGSIIEATPDSSALFFRAVSGRSSDQLSSATIPWGVGIVGHVAESRQPVLVEDASSDPRYLRSIGAAVDFEVRTLMAAPIVIRDRLFCVVELLNRLGQPAFDAHDQDLLVRIAEMAARAIEVRLMFNGARQGIEAAA